MKEIQLKMNEMCNLLGITSQAIRLYEKYNAIHSFKYEGNGYRYYYFEDIGPAIFVRHLRKFGFSLEQAGGLVQGNDAETLIRSLEEQEDSIKKEIIYQQEMLKRCTRLKEMLPKCLSDIHKYSECIRPAMYFLPCERNGQFLHTPKDKKLIRKWSEYYPFVHFCPMTESDSLNPESVSQAALCLFEEDRHLLPEDTWSAAEYIPSAKCIGGITKVAEDATDYYSVLEKGLDYMRDAGYELTGRIYSVLLVSGIRIEEKKEDYYYIWYEYKIKSRK